MRMLARFFLGAFVLLGMTASCNSIAPKGAAMHVQIVKTGSKYQMMVDGKEYRIQGAGLEFGDIKSLTQAGANSFRTWRTENGQTSGMQVLDSAKANGLTVSMCVELKRERHGMNYSDSVAVAAQKEDIRTQVLALKNHPALLTWIIGNELNLNYTNMAVWDAVEDIAKMIKDIDGNHPVSTALAGINKKEIDYIKVHCPTLDFICIQMYGDVINLQQRITEAGWIDRPYVVSEWGATGHWEVSKTTWGAPIEQSSSEKAASIQERYEKAISQDLNNNLGYYIFLWGQKQECTSTWYGLFSDNGMITQPIDYMKEIWKGKRPANSSPRIKSALLDGKEKSASIKLESNKEYTALVEAFDIDNDVLTFHSEVVPESTDRKSGGDDEIRPDAIADAVSDATHSGITFKSPSKVGKYRLFVYVYDGKGSAATVNFPFLIE